MKLNFGRVLDLLPPNTWLKVQGSGQDYGRRHPKYGLTTEG
tara:strand:+ start:5755 stop:5877 length:123 start_codon:yes stop_codon:yes gene_type:complete